MDKLNLDYAITFIVRCLAPSLLFEERTSGLVPLLHVHTEIHQAPRSESRSTLVLRSTRRRSLLTEFCKEFEDIERLV